MNQNKSLWETIEPDIKKVIAAYRRSKKSRRYILEKLDLFIEENERDGFHDVAKAFAGFKKALLSEVVK